MADERQITLTDQSLRQRSSSGAPIANLPVGARLSEDLPGGIRGVSPRSAQQRETREQKERREQKEAEDRRRIRQATDLNQIRIQREQDIARGRSFIGGELEQIGFGGGQLGAEAFARGGADIQDILSRRRAALGGLEAPEAQALREQALSGIRSQEATRLRDIRGEIGQLRGPAAIAAQQSIRGEAGQQISDLEQQLLIRNIGERQRALGEFETSALGAQAFDVSQAQRELATRTGGALGFAGLGAAERGEVSGLLGGEEFARAIESAGGGGGKKSHFCMEFFKRRLISGSDLMDLTGMVIKGLFARGDWTYWYMKNANKIAANANALGHDWKRYANVPRETIQLMNKYDFLRGGDNYMKYCYEMWIQYGFTDPNIDAWDDGFWALRPWKRFMGTVKCLLIPKNLLYGPGVLWARVKYNLRDHRKKWFRMKLALKEKIYG